MATLMRAPSCTIGRAGAATAADGVFDEMQGSCQAPMVFYDGGTGARYVFIGDMKGEITFSDIEFEYTSGAAVELELTTDDVLLSDGTGGNTLAITVSFGDVTILSFTQCSPLFAVPDLKQMGEIVMARGNHSYRIWDPDTTPVTIAA